MGATDRGVVGCAVVIGMLFRVNCSPTCRNVISARKIERKKKLTTDSPRDMFNVGLLFVLPLVASLFIPFNLVVVLLSLLTVVSS
jgi:hypothetical protein